MNDPHDNALDDKAMLEKLTGRPGVLRWGKPPREVPHEEWAAYQLDDGPPGAWVPNMPDDWKLAWKAKMAGQRSEGHAELRVEIRKTVYGKTAAHRYSAAQVLVVVYHDGPVRVSMNGTAEFSAREWHEFGIAESEARTAMSGWLESR